MIERKRYLLGLMLFCKEGSGRVHRTRLVKYAFLLRERQYKTIEAPAYYDFVPYRFGPFSFELFHDLSALQKDGLVNMDPSDEDSLSLSASQERALRQEFESLPWEIRQAICDLAREYGNVPLADLLQGVYTKYPYYASKSCLHKPKPAREQTAAVTAVFTAGYEGRSVDGFFDVLLRHAIAVVVDVRKNPVSRKYGFAGTSLAAIADKLGMQYRHTPELGIPSAKRLSLSSREDYDRLFEWYREKSLPAVDDSVAATCSLVKSAKSVLVCMEQDPACCHRSHLADLISKRTELAVEHL